MPESNKYRSAMMFVAGAACMALVMTAWDKYQSGRTDAPAHPQVTSGAPPSATMPAESQPAPLVSEAEITAFKAAAEKNPDDIQAVTHLANVLFDAKRYEESITWYQKVLEKTPNDANISTDLGTALWYLGRTDEALAQFDKSLAINPTHPQTLYNIGIVKLHGKNDTKGALAAWEKLVATNPDYPQAVQLQSRIKALKEML